MRFGIVLFLGMALAASAAVRGDDAMYIGGTLQVPEKTKGQLDTSAAEQVTFSYKGGKVEIPAKQIESLEYGQKVGRRVGAAVAVSPVLLLSKKRKHFLTVSYKDAAGAGQSAVFEVAKGALHDVVGALETKSGKKVVFESDEARKHYESESK